MASLYLRNTKFWISYYDKELQKSCSKSTGLTDQREAEKLLKKFEAELELGLHKPVTYSNPKTILFSEGLDKFISLRDIKPRTEESYRQAASRLVEACGDKPIYRYNDDDYSKLLNLFKDRGFRQRTKFSYLNQLRYMFKYFVSKGYIKEMPFGKVKKGDIEVKDIPLWTLGRVLNRLSGERYEMIKLIYLAALRKGEVQNVMAEDFDFKKQAFYIRNQKGNRLDTIPMTADLEKFGLKHFQNRKGKLFNTGYDGLRFFWEKLETGYTLHSLRKARGTYLAEKGVEPLFLMEFMRHNELSTTLQYYVNIKLDNARRSLNMKLFKR